ncbi:adenylate kinase [Thermoproteota archaeon]
MNCKRVVIVGIPGVGKTTVVDKVKDILHSKGINTKYVIFGSIMMKEAEKLGLNDRDGMRHLPVNTQRKLQVAASSEISKIEAEILLVDTHLFIKTNEGYWPGLPFDVATTLSPTHIFLIIAAPKEIISRRLNDTSRRRDNITENDVIEELEIAQNMLCSLSIITGAAMMQIQNANAKFDKAANSIVSALGVI